MDHYLDMYQQTLGPLMGKRGLQYVITDSWEAGVQNWTDDMIAEFTRRRGYDPRPWMPVLTGRIVESAEASAPQACEIAVRCGTCVMGIRTARGIPMAVPIRRAMTIHS